MEKLKIKIAIVFISLCNGLQLTISPVLNQIQNNYPHIDVSWIQMLITAPALLSMVTAVISGWLVVKISKKKLLVFASFMCGITGFIPFLSNSFAVLFLSRTLFGVGLGLCIALNTAVVAEHFEGEERVSAMGLQGASVGSGMLLSTTLGGLVGSYGYQFTYFIHIIGLISSVMIFWLLPETGKVVTTKTEKIELNKKVYKIGFLGLLELIFLTSFTTNIAMHISGSLAGDPTVSGNLTGVFSGIQIFAGLALGYINRFTKKNTLQFAMLSFGVGCILLVLFPSSYVMLLIAAMFCGMSQGIFIPQAMYEVSSAVKPVATAMASAYFTVFTCFGQFISPAILNTLSNVAFGSITTTNVYLISAIAMVVISTTLFIKKRTKMRSFSESV